MDRNRRSVFTAGQRLRGIGVPALAALLLTATAVSAAEPSPTEKALERAEKALQQEKGLSNETRDALQELLRALRDERAAAGKAQPTPTPPKDAASKPGTKTPSRLTISGDFRLRHESNFELTDQPDRHRERVRFRLGAIYQLSDELQVGARVATGPRTDAQSPHQTLGEAFHKFELNLDRAFASYRPQRAPGLSLTAGKFGHPFWTNPVYGELVWDQDVQPEGAVVGYSIKGKGALERVDVNLGEYLLLEQSLGDESTAFVGQVAAHGKLGKHFKPSVAVGYYNYSDLTPDRSQSLLSENSGNAIVGTGPTTDFASRFEILNPILALTYQNGKYPWVFSGEYIHNLRAANDHDSGWAAGLAYGATQKKGDWRLYYQRQVVQQDAVFSLVSQDDFLFSTNHRSHVFGANYQVRDNLGLHLWALLSRPDSFAPGTVSPNRDLQWRLRLDANFRF